MYTPLPTFGRKTQKSTQTHADGLWREPRAGAGWHWVAALLPQFHVVGREEPVSAFAHPTPPAIVNHFYVGDDVIRVKRDLIIASYGERAERDSDEVT